MPQRDLVIVVGRRREGDAVPRPGGWSDEAGAASELGAQLADLPEGGVRFVAILVPTPHILHPIGEPDGRADQDMILRQSGRGIAVKSSGNNFVFQVRCGSDHLPTPSSAALERRVRNQIHT